MKKIASCLIAIIVLTGSSLLMTAENKLQGKVLVLGFQSKYISDFQDRLLRESVMRDLAGAGYSIVPVMELEGFFLDYHTPVQNVRNYSLEKICRELDAWYSIKGFVSGTEDSFIYNITIYDRRKNFFHTERIPVERNKSFNDYCPVLAKEIVKRFGEVLKK